MKIKKFNDRHELIEVEVSEEYGKGWNEAVRQATYVTECDLDQYEGDYALPTLYTIHPDYESEE